MKGRREKWWERRNNLEKLLIVIIAFLLCFALFVFIVLMLHFNRLFANDTPVVEPCVGSEVVKTTESINTGTKSCMTPACVKVAAQIIDFVNVSADPCKNFYGFTCATFHKRWTETKGLTGIKPLRTMIESRINAMIMDSTDQHFSEALELQRKFYNSCTNTTEIDEDENDALLNLIEKVGGWPIMRGRFWNSKKFTWIQSLVKCRRLGIDLRDLLKVDKKQVVVNGIKSIVLSLSPPTTPSVPSYFRDDYIELLTNLSLELNAISYNYAKEEFIRVFDFQDKIKNISADKEENISSNMLLQVKVLQEKIPGIPWIDFLNDLSVTGIPFTNDSWVDIPAIKYLQGLDTLLKNTPKSTQANYIMWKIVENHRNYLSGSLRQQYNSFLIKLNPALVVTDRKSFCLTKAKFYFPSVAESTYLKYYIPKQTSLHIKQITEKIKRQIQSKIEKSELFDEEFKKTIVIRQLDDVINSQNFNKAEETFNLQTDNIVDMDTQLYARTMDNYFKDVNKKISDIKEEKLKTFSIFNVNAMEDSVLYTLFLDQITSHLRSPYYVNYGSMGSAIGQQLTRFIFQKYKIDTVNTSWLYNVNRLDEEIEECVLNHQNSSNEDEISTNYQQKVSKESLIYGSMGVDLAYKAYHEWVKENGPEQTLPGLSYNQNQTFWIMFAISECLQLGKNYFEDENYTAWPPISIKITSQNSADFAAAFNCPSEKKCQML